MTTQLSSFFFLKKNVYLNEYLQSVLGGTISKRFSIRLKKTMNGMKELHIRGT